MININFEELKQEYKDLLEQAEKARGHSYSPYSRVAVGAAILTNSNRIIKGANVENAVLGLSICAEQSAIVSANTIGERNFIAIAIISSLNEIISPCGACRQIFFEFSKASGVDFDVIMSDKNKTKIIIAKISELLPLPFEIKKS
jgi:cytidine deaminase